jgi:hypothetical protein
VNLQPLFDTAIPLQDAINQLLQPLIGPYKATTAPIVGNDGQTTEAYSTIVYNGGNEPPAVPVDNVAAVIDCYDELTIETLETAYQRIRVVKSIPKTDRPGPADGDVHMTTGFVVARNSNLTLEKISSEMSRLNESMPSHYWPDAVAVLSTGLVSYSARIPTLEKSGDFFLPMEVTATHSPSPSVWIEKVIRAVGDLTFDLSPANSSRFG